MVPMASGVGISSKSVKSVKKVKKTKGVKMTDVVQRVIASVAGA